MNSIRKCSINKHQSENIKPAVRWQSYLLALVMVFGFFFFTQKVLAEAKGGKAPVAVKAPRPAAKPLELSQIPSGLQEETTKLAETSEVAAQEAFDSTAELEESAAAPEPGTPQETQIGPRQLEKPEDTELAAAKGLVTEFYGDLNSGRIGTAYDKLSPEFRQSLSYERFDAGYSATSAISCEVQHVENVSDDLVRVDIAIAVTEDDTDSSYYATCLVKKVDDAWLLDGVGQVRG